MNPHHSGCFSSLPCSAAFPPDRPLACPPWAPLSPRAEPFFLPCCRALQKRMADMSVSGLSIGPVEFIYVLVAEARSDLLLPSDPVSQHRAADHLLLP